MVRDAGTNEVETDENAELDEEKLLILPLNDKSSKLISQVISNDTARDILETISDAPRSTTEIAEKLGIPLTTVQYNLEKLAEAGLVKVARTRYSRKMKPVKLYAPQRKYVVIAPGKAERSDVIAALKRYLTLIAVAIFGSLAIEGLMMRLGAGPVEDMAVRSVPDGYGGGAETPLYAPAPAAVPEKAVEAGAGFDLFMHPGLWFFLGCLFVLALVLLFDYRARRKAKSG
ncbi:MAG: helix-turn-helix transcriptional regulator [Methanomicrobia archaeon]|nr:helix-turn-helix transcriptional regulator [Methanomicrobia archaeon]